MFESPTTPCVWALIGGRALLSACASAGILPPPAEGDGVGGVELPPIGDLPPPAVWEFAAGPGAAAWSLPAFAAGLFCWPTIAWIDIGSCMAWPSFITV